MQPGQIGVAEIPDGVAVALAFEVVEVAGAGARAGGLVVVTPVHGLNDIAARAKDIMRSGR